MKKAWFVYLLIVCRVSYLLGQSAEPIYFREKIFDFGDVREEGGPVAHEFQFTNLSGRSITILSVQPSCGCTTSGWTEGAIAHGKSGAIKANFDPQGRPGFFSKTLTITTDFDTNPIVLQIKGNVISPGASSADQDWKMKWGQLRAKNASINFGKVFINKDPVTLSFPLYLAGPKRLKLYKVNSAAYLKVVFPSEINAGQTAKLQVTFDAKGKGQYGFVSESFELETDDIEMPIKRISVYATVEESFATLSAEELAMAPTLGLELNTVDFGSVRNETELKREVKLTNFGKKDLIIRSLQSNCSCLKSSLNKMKLKPGEQASLQVSLTTPSHSGPIQKAVTIYSNDPKNPVQRVVLSAIVN